MKRCCENCKVKKQLTKYEWWCPVKKKKIRPTEYDNKCGGFVPYMTDEEVKEFWEEVRKLGGWPSKKQRGRTYQLKRARKENIVIKFPENSPIQWETFMIALQGITVKELFVTEHYYNNLTKEQIEYLEGYYGKKLVPMSTLQQ